LVSHSPNSVVLLLASSAVSPDWSAGLGRGSFLWKSQYSRTWKVRARRSRWGIGSGSCGGFTFLRTLLVTLGRGIGALTSPISDEVQDVVDARFKASRTRRLAIPIKTSDRRQGLALHHVSNEDTSNRNLLIDLVGLIIGSWDERMEGR
jgi:hypothetical protein